MRRGLPPVDDRTLLAAYQRVLARTPDATGQADEAGSVTFAGSYERSLRLAAGAAARAAGPREPAALLLDNSLDAVHVWSGLGLGGRVEVPVNTAYKGRFLSHVLNDSGAELIVIEDGYADRLAAVADQLTALRTVAGRGGAGRGAGPARRVPGDPAGRAGGARPGGAGARRRGRADGVHVHVGHHRPVQGRADLPRAR